MNDFEILLDPGGQVILRGHLQHLPFRDRGGSGGQDVHDLERTVIGHELERPGEQEVPHQHRRLVPEHRVRAGHAPAQGTFVHHVIMQQRGRMDELHARGQRHMALVRGVGAVTAQPRGSQRQQRAQPFAASRDQVGRKLWNECDRAVHPLDNGAVTRGHVISKIFRQIAQGDF